MLGKSIQLPFEVIRGKAKEKSIKLNLPPNFRKDVLFDQLPYLSHLENPAIKNAIKDSIVYNLSFQKYHLATGLSKYSIQDSLDMIVSDGKFNSAAVRRALDTKYPSVMKKSNPIDVIFKDKAKFNTQNPIIGTLLTIGTLLKGAPTQIESGKIRNGKPIENQLIAEPLEQLRENNRKNNNEDDGNHDENPSPPSAPPSFILPLYYPPSLSIDNEDSDIGNDLNSTQKFLLGDTPQQEKNAVAAEEKHQQQLKIF